MKKIFLLVLVLICINLTVFADQTAGLTEVKLDNGLELFILENHNVPLTTVQITFRCGAITQRPETAGLFHLYEHLLFKGNENHTSQSEFLGAMTSLGVGNWNGGTNAEYVTYYFTIPSNKTEEGLGFWADAVRYPLLSQEELDEEKEVVVNEIRGYHNDPNDQFQSALDSKLFYRYPWRRDLGGSVENILNASVEQMQEINNLFYTPNNCAIFVAGDVDPENIIDIVDTYFGDWEESSEIFEIVEPHPDLESDENIVFQDPSLYPGFAIIRMTMRGPDVLEDPEATYAADVLLALLDNPNSSFREAIFNSVEGLYAKEYISKGYYTQKDGGTISFSTFAYANEMFNPYQVATDFKEAVFNEIYNIVNDPEYFESDEFDIVKTILEDYKIYSLEVPSSFISNYSFWWASASTEYYQSYVRNMRKVTNEEIARYLTDYIIDKYSILSIQLNPQTYNQFLQDDGFEEITKDNCYWWQNN